MATIDLSPNFVRAVQLPEIERKIDYFDRDQRGFLLEVRKSGGKTYYQRYTDPRGRTKQ